MLEHSDRLRDSYKFNLFNYTFTFWIDKRYDSKGFSFFIHTNKFKIFGLFLHGWRTTKLNSKLINRFGCLFRLDFGRGAGYINGITFFVGHNVKGGYKYLYTPALFRFGFTKSANNIPYGFGC